MRFRFTLFLLVANLVVFGLIWNNARQRNVEPPRAELVFPTDPDAVTVATDNAATSYTLKRTDATRWSLEKPFRWPANPWIVQKLLNQMRSVSRSGRFSLEAARKQGDDKIYGFDKPLCTLTVSAGTRDVTVKIGGPTPDGNARYMLASDGDSVLPASSELIAAILPKPEDIRREEVFSIDAFEVRAVDVTSAEPSVPEMRVRLVREKRDLQGGESKSVWIFEIPKSDANTPVVDNNLSELGKLKFLRFMESTPALLRDAHLEEPLFSLTLDGNNRTQTLQVGGPDAKSGYRFAKLKDNPAIFTIPESALKIWRGLPVTMREPYFLHTDDATLTGITIHIDGLSLVLHPIDSGDGDKKAGAKAADTREWQMPAIPGGKVLEVTPVDANILTVLQKSLTNLSARDFQEPSGATPEITRLCRAFVTDNPTKEELAAWGLDTPKWKVELAFTREGKSFKRTLLIARNTVPGTPYHAKLDDSPSVYSIAPAITEPDILSVKPETYRRRLIFAMQPGESLTAVRIADLLTKKTLVDEKKPDDVAAWDTWLANRPETERKEVLAMIGAIQEKLSARSFLDAPYSDDFKYDSGNGARPEGWRYRIEWDVKPAGSDPARRDHHVMMATRSLGGSTQIGGVQNASAIFELPQPWIDALYPLTFGRDSSADLPAIPVPAKPDAAPKGPVADPAKPATTEDAQPAK